MKRLVVLFYRAMFIMIVGIGVESGVCANSIKPLSLLDINALPAVATDGNDNVTITWGYLGLGNIPSILAKRYNPDGDPIDNVGFWVSSPPAAPSIFNYGPDIATDSVNNSVITWCSYELSFPAKNIQVVYTKVEPPRETNSPGTISKITAISPQQGGEEEEITLLNIPFSPVIAIDSSDNIAIAWSYYDFKSGKNGIYLVVIDSQGTAIDPVKIVDNTEEVSSTSASAAGMAVRKGAVTVSGSGVKPIFYYAPSIAFDGDGNIVITWTATGLMPFLVGDTAIPLTTIYYSKYDTSGTVISGYDKKVVAMGFSSTVAVDSSGNMIIAWNSLDIFTLKVRIMAAIYSVGESSSKRPFEVGVRSDYVPSDFVDNGNYFLNTGIDIAADSEGNFFITWGGSNIFNTHIYLKGIYSDGYLSNEVQVSQGFDLSYGPSIATNSRGDIIITWNKFSLANLFTGAFSVYARRYDSNLQAQGNEFKVNIGY